MKLFYRIAAVMVVLAASFESPANARTSISHLVSTCASWLQSDSGKYKTSSMSLVFYAMDLTVSYVPKSELPDLAIEYDAISKNWIYSKSKMQVEPGSYMFVMDQHGQLFILRIYSANRHHSSFFRGRPVASAGHLEFDRASQISSMSTATGHYYRGFRDACQNWKQFLGELRSRGVLTDQIRITELRGSLVFPQPAVDFYVSAQVDLAKPCEDRTGLLERPAPVIAEDAYEDHPRWRQTTVYLSDTGQVTRPFKSFGELRNYTRLNHEESLPRLDSQKRQVLDCFDAQDRDEPIYIKGYGSLKVIGLYPGRNGVELKFVDSDGAENQLDILGLDVGQKDSFVDH